MRKYWVLALFSLAMVVSLTSATIRPLDDHFHYKRFIEVLAEGRVDFSIPGFHGSSFLALPIYLVTGSPLTNIYFQIFCAALLVPLGYLAVSSLLKDRVAGLLFAGVMTMSPFFFFLAFRGFTFASFTLLLFLSIWLYSRSSRFTWLPLGMSFITKPFSIALAPLMLLWPKQNKRAVVQLALALCIPALYIVTEYLQIGRIIVGAHPHIDQASVFTSGRVFLNAAHGIQMLFSVHNYYFPDPALTGPGNLVHSSPILMFLGVFTLLYPAKFWKDNRFVWGMRFGVLSAFMLAAMLDHMDHFYMEVTVLLLIIASLPALRLYPLLIPFVLATLHFQWLYGYLTFVEPFAVTPVFFAAPLIVDILFAVLCVLHRDSVQRYLKGQPISPPSQASVLLV